VLNEPKQRSVHNPTIPVLDSPLDLRYILTSKMNRRGVPMTNISTTKMSSKGQVVIPEDIRKRLNLKAGAQFIVVGNKDVVILKNISPPELSDFDELIAEARKTAKAAGIKKTDIEDAISKARGKLK